MELHIAEPLVVRLADRALRERLDVRAERTGDRGVEPAHGSALERRGQGGRIRDVHAHLGKLVRHGGEPVGRDVLLQAAPAGDLLDVALHRAADLGAACGVDQPDVVHDVRDLACGVADELGRPLGLERPGDTGRRTHQLRRGRKPDAPEQVVEASARRLGHVLQKIQEHAVRLGPRHEGLVAVLPRGLLQPQRRGPHGGLARNGLHSGAEGAGDGFARKEHCKASRSGPERKVEAGLRKRLRRTGRTRHHGRRGLRPPLAEIRQSFDDGIAHGAAGRVEEPEPLGILRHVRERRTDRALRQGVGYLVGEPGCPLLDTGHVRSGLLHDVAHSGGRGLGGACDELRGLHVRLGRLGRRLEHTLLQVGLDGGLDEHFGKLRGSRLGGTGHAGVGEELHRRLGGLSGGPGHHCGPERLHPGSGEAELGEERRRLVDDAADHRTPRAVGLHLVLGAEERGLDGLFPRQGLSALHLAERIGRLAGVIETSTDVGELADVRHEVPAQDSTVRQRIQKIVRTRPVGDRQKLGATLALCQLVRGKRRAVHQCQPRRRPLSHRGGALRRRYLRDDRLGIERSRDSRKKRVRRGILRTAKSRGLIKW